VLLIGFKGSPETDAPAYLVSSLEMTKNKFYNTTTISKWYKAIFLSLIIIGLKGSPGTYAPAYLVSSSVMTKDKSHNTTTFS
jgi:hypothetical protein